MTRFDALLWDLDGTLVDSIELILASYRHAFEVVRGQALPDELWLRGIGTPLIEQLRGFTDDPQELETLLDVYRRHAVANHDRMIRVFPGIDSTLRALVQRGVPLCIVTSKRRLGVERALRACRLEGLFADAVASDDTTQHKPHPAPVFLALERLGASPETTLFVGDSLHDLHAGRRAGVSTAAALWGPFDRERLGEAEPDLWLESPEQVLDLV